MGQPSLVNLIKGAGEFQSNESIWFMFQKVWDNRNIEIFWEGKSTFPDPSGVHFSQAFIHPPIQLLCDSVRRKIEILR